MHPDWRPTVAVTLAATGAVLLAVTLRPGHARRCAAAGWATWPRPLCLLALLPLLVLATGIYAAIRS